MEEKRVRILVILVGVILTLSIVLNGLLALALFTEKKADFQGSYQTEMNVGEGGRYIVNLDTNEMTFSIKFTDTNGDNDYIQSGKIMRMEERMAILVNDNGEKYSVFIDKKNKKLSYYDVARDLILSFEKLSRATVKFSDN